MPVERRGQAIRVMIALVNWQQEEPNGCGGGQQLLMNGTSRVNREIYARFCERLGVKFPGPTRRCWVTRIPTATASPRAINGMLSTAHPHSKSHRYARYAPARRFRGEITPRLFN